MNLRLFLFLLYVLPGRSKSDVVSHFPRNHKNALIYDVNSDYTYKKGNVYRLNPKGELKLYCYLAGIGGFIVAFISVLSFLL